MGDEREPRLAAGVGNDSDSVFDEHRRADVHGPDACGRRSSNARVRRRGDRQGNRDGRRAPGDGHRDGGDRRIHAGVGPADRVGVDRRRRLQAGRGDRDRGDVHQRGDDHRDTADRADDRGKHPQCELPPARIGHKVRAVPVHGRHGRHRQRRVLNPRERARVERRHNRGRANGRKSESRPQRADDRCGPPRQRRAGGAERRDMRPDDGGADGIGRGCRGRRRKRDELLAGHERTPRSADGNTRPDHAQGDQSLQNRRFRGTERNHDDVHHGEVPSAAHPRRTVRRNDVADVTEPVSQTGTHRTRA